MKHIAIVFITLIGVLVATLVANTAIKHFYPTQNRWSTSDGSMDCEKKPDGEIICLASESQKAKWIMWQIAERKAKVEELSGIELLLEADRTDVFGVTDQRKLTIFDKRTKTFYNFDPCTNEQKGLKSGDRVIFEGLSEPLDGESETQKECFLKIVKVWQ